ncbi:MAG TPA: SLC13 family permease [Haliangium sp.]|nr:SLC13 family permease [Haliangium sp.]
MDASDARTDSPDATETGAAAPSRARIAVVAAIATAASALCLALIDDPVLARAAVVAGVFLILSLTEIVPPFVPVLVLLVGTPVLMGSFGAPYRLPAVLTWPADPVLALFAGGLALGLAARRHGIDAAIARIVVHLSSGHQRRLLALVLLGTATMSMWMSNIAAAAVMLTALRPAVGHMDLGHPFRRAVLLAVAIGANLGGIATPIGTGPNAIAIAAAWERHPLTFLGWMIFALPLALGMLVLGYAILVLRYRVRGAFEQRELPRAARSSKAPGVVVLFSLAVLAWISEPFHGLSAPLIALAVALALFGSGLLGKRDLGALDWSTLGLIAGGVSVGKLIEHAGLFTHVTEMVDWTALPPLVWLGGLVLASALLSALMSNTATAALLVPLAMTLDASPATAVIIAISASFGMPFTISTPPNAMAYGEGGLTARDLLWVGLSLMLIGCALVTLTGPPVLRLLGVP